MPIMCPPAILSLGLLLVLGACGTRDEPVPLPDNALLADDIRVDPDRLGGGTAAAPPPVPGAASGKRAARSPPVRCADRVVLGDGWAGRLPAAFPVYPGATLSEAGGAAGDCDLRVASFRTDAPIDRVLDWYAGRATAAGYSAARERRGQERLVAGTRGDDAFVVTARTDRGGTEVDLIANAGR